MLVQSCGASSIWYRAIISPPIVILTRRSSSESGSLLLADRCIKHCIAQYMAASQ